MKLILEFTPEELRQFLYGQPESMQEKEIRFKNFLNEKKAEINSQIKKGTTGDFQQMDTSTKN
jgi:DNA-binding transcriptional MerR regulator